MSARLNDTDVEKHLASLNGWSIDSRGELTKTFRRHNFMDGLAFVNQIAQLAEAAGHHPDLLLTYPSVRVALTTHDAGGLTEKDFALAQQIEALATTG